jgi:hypothetical protein
MLEDNQNSNCERAEELVSYLYDELGGKDKARFEKHLAVCSSCAAELSEFSLARTFVQEWRDEQFLPLPTPLIEIPLAHSQKQGSISRSWLTAVRDLLTLSPAWTTAATAAAATVIFVALSLVMFNSLPENDDVLVKQTGDNKNIKVSPSPTIANNQNISVGKETTGSQTGSSPKPLNVDNPSGEANAPVKISTTTKPANNKRPGQVRENIKSPKNQTKQTAPRLIDDEEEDDSLRLSDLLEGIGSDD